MNAAGKFLMLLNVLFFVAIIGVVIYFQTSAYEAKQAEALTNLQL